MNLVSLYPFLSTLHYWVSRVGLLVAVLMFAAGLFIGLVRHGDVTPYYRRAVYIVAGVMVIQAVIGLSMYVMGFRPYEEVHLIYGAGAVLALPFFIFVEVTAKKRPSMGSYMWGFAVLAGILVRGIMTGHA